MHLRPFSRAAAVALCAILPAAAQTLSAPDVLKRVAETYRNLKSIDVTAQQRFEVAGGSASAAGESQLVFAMAPGGKYLAAVKASERDYTIVSDGENTWRYVPKAKQWSREAASSAAESGDDEEQNQPAAPNDAKDPLSKMQHMFIDRYTHIDRFAATARLDRDDRVKVDGDKIDCYKVVLSLRTGAHEMLIDKQRFLVLRHIETARIEWNGVNAQQRTTVTARLLDTAAPASRFTFSPPPKTTEVGMLILPGEDRPNLTGKAAADFVLKDLQGTKVRLSELHGKIVLLDFWATWCPPCRRELPSVAKLHEKLKDKDVVVLGINDEESSTVKSYLKKNDIALTVLMDSGGNIHKLYGTRAIPTVVIIDRTGTITSYYVGARSEDDLMNALKGAGLQI